MSQRVSTDEVLAAELKRCKKVLRDLYNGVTASIPNRKDFSFAVGSPKDVNLQRFQNPGLRMSYIADKLGAEKGSTRVEEAENTAHMDITASEYQVTYRVHITFEEYLRQ